MSLELLVVGADGMDPRLTEYFIEKGYLPTIESLITDGAQFGPLASRLSGNDVPHTGPAWSTIYTGLTEEYHGVTEGGWTKGDISLSPHYEQTVFADLQKEGYEVGAMTMAITYPAQTLSSNSWMISGYPSAETGNDIVSPDELVDKLPDDFGDLKTASLLDVDGPTEVDNWCEAEERKRSEVVAKILNDIPVDVLFYGTQITDSIAHQTIYEPRYLDGGVRRLISWLNDTLGTSLVPPRLGTIAWSSDIRQAYESVDSTLATLIDAHDPDEVLLVSDHGFQLHSRDHAYLGLSLATNGIHRPEYITEVKRSILSHFEIEEKDDVSVIKRDDTFDEQESDEIESQLEALGYIE